MSIRSLVVVTTVTIGSGLLWGKTELERRIPPPKSESMQGNQAVSTHTDTVSGMVRKKWTGDQATFCCCGVSSNRAGDT
jgi:hypothetical protein